jgi:hypothetical protein
MRKPGRPSPGDLAVQLIDGGATRPLQPPFELSEAERETFASIVATVKAGHFQPADARLIGLYAQALGLARRSGEALDRDLTNPAPTLIRAYNAATQRVCSLATKLRLTPQSRSPQKSARTNDAPRQVSYYDHVAAGGTAAGWRSDP